jgi:hypothetical protein
VLRARGVDSIDIIDCESVASLSYSYATLINCIMSLYSFRIRIRTAFRGTS